MKMKVEFHYLPEFERRARVLTYNLKKIEPDRISITFLSIFDKSDMENVSDSYIKSLVKEAIL